VSGQERREATTDDPRCSFYYCRHLRSEHRKPAREPGRPIRIGGRVRRHCTVKNCICPDYQGVGAFLDC
jgi:hypothetical protein